MTLFISYKSYILQWPFLSFLPPALSYLHYHDINLMLSVIKFHHLTFPFPKICNTSPPKLYYMKFKQFPKIYFKTNIYQLVNLSPNQN